MTVIRIWWTRRVRRVSHSGVGHWRGMVRGAGCWPLVRFAHRPERGYVLLLRDYLGMSGCVPEYLCVT